ncbi:hypothetical protein [Salinigranum salinum]|uniref:hypothetical protein n=1 Tax=Salinigranum salinum TaxID=1364937 RepID=UPI0018643F1A|nr:hypothetical protein [Salinigranum salinum]
MTVGSALRELGRFLEEFEQRAAVTTVDLVDAADSSGVDGLTVEVELTVATSSDGPGSRAELLSLVSTTVGDDGRLRLGFETAEPLVPTTDHDVTVEPAGATVGDETMVVRLAVSVPTSDDPTSEGTGDRGERTSGNATEESGAAADGESGSPSADRGPDPHSDSDSGSDTDTDPESNSEAERTVPPFRDPDLLASVYESCETFAEMADRIDMDVTAETVRRYMIDYDIHQPNTYATASTRADETATSDAEGETATPETAEEVQREAETAGWTEPTERTGSREQSKAAERAKSTTRDEADADESETPVVLADGIGLPNDVAVETLVEAVKRSNTIYDVERHVGVDREEAVTLLRELGLLDLVVGRLATEAQRDISREVVVDRLREASATRS